MSQIEIVLILYNIRSAHNVGAILRTAEGLGVTKVYLAGYTPYPKKRNDERLPHLQAKVEAQIHKTALGAEESLSWEQEENINTIFKFLRSDGYLIAALEQTVDSQPLNKFYITQPTAIVLGNEVTGLSEEVLCKTDKQLSIPMLGSKESFNVAAAAAITLYHLRYFKQ